MEIDEKLNSFKHLWEGLQRHLPFTMFLCNPSFLREGTSLGENILASCLTDLKTTSLVERSLTAALSHI